jgi:hypothetical protein
MKITKFVYHINILVTSSDQQNPKVDMSNASNGINEEQQQQPKIVQQTTNAIKK